MKDKNHNDVGEILDKEIHEYYERLDKVAKAETKVIKSLEEKVASKKKRLVKGLLRIIPSLGCGIGMYSLLRYGVKFNQAISVTGGIVSAIGGAVLYDIYYAFKN